MVGAALRLESYKVDEDVFPNLMIMVPFVLAVIVLPTVFFPPEEEASHACIVRRRGVNAEELMHTLILNHIMHTLILHTLKLMLTSNG